MRIQYVTFSGPGTVQLDPDPAQNCPIRSQFRLLQFNYIPNMFDVVQSNFTVALHFNYNESHSVMVYLVVYFYVLYIY